MTSAIPGTTLGMSGGPAVGVGPISMSFPAILCTPGLVDRFAHLRLTSAWDEPTSDATRLVVKKNKRED